ncbi:unnamed protein product [Rotaria sp. Silwood1]|nr:unnamed protein product [Rotaria sp. Silwood1]CAF3404435.1 unnamed protein product [Rotaria sp. Silwood1]CAF4629553.1 unnamed protein product [Rotaria sp. Silwood1]CAF5110889.1 unnamed protein product [Rotaria sp. Silwood1]
MLGIEASMSYTEDLFCPADVDSESFFNSNFDIDKYTTAATKDEKSVAQSNNDLAKAFEQVKLLANTK